MDPLLIAATAGVLFVAAVVRSTVGFGDALVAMPLLVALLGARTASPVVALVAGAAGLAVLWSAWRAVDWKGAGRLLLAGVPGVAAGVFGLKQLPEAWIAAGLGGMLIVYGLSGFRPTRADAAPASPHWGWPLGFAAGALGGAMNTSGPPLVVFATMQRWSPARTRGTLQGVFIPMSAIVLVSHAVAGLWTREVLTLSAASLPAMGVGVAVGGWLNRRIPATRFQHLLYGLLVVLGGMLLVM